MHDEFMDAVTARYDDGTEFVDVNLSGVIELFETGSAIFLLDNAYLVKLEVSKL